MVNEYKTGDDDMIKLNELESKIYDLTEEYHSKIEAVDNFNLVADRRINELTAETDIMMRKMKVDGINDNNEMFIEYIIKTHGITALQNNKIVMLTYINKLADKINKLQVNKGEI